MALDAILEAIRVVAAGDALIAPSVTRQLIADFAGTSGPAAPEPDAGPAADSSPIAAMTDREREVLALVAAGLGFGEYLSLAPAPPEARVGGRSVLLIWARAADPKTAARIREQFADEFASPAGRFAELAVAAELLQTVSRGDNLDLEPVLRQHVAALLPDACPGSAEPGSPPSGGLPGRLALGASLAAALVGLLAGLCPSLRAAGMEPVDALLLRAPS
ncbi:transcriptional regulator [Streptomyces sasae]|uniref:hypothetical protein n=1 Tax=Streptomyces sasae TaxID=1266772 RepID=UPI00374219C6